MAVITGKGGAIEAGGTTFPCVREWRIQGQSIIPAAYCTSSHSGPVRIDGNKDWHGVLSAYGGYPLVSALPGMTFTLKFTGLDPAGPTYPGLQSAENGAIVDRVRVVWDIQNALYLHHFIWFSSNGALSAYTTPRIVDTGEPSPISAKGKTILLGTVGAGYGSAVPESNVTRIQLDLICKNAPYVDSSTSGDTHRKEGNVDWTVQWRRNISAPSDLTTLWNTIKECYIQTVTGETPFYWTVNHIIPTRWVPIYSVEGERDSRAKIVAADIFAQGAGWGTAGGNEGAIYVPDATAQTGTKFWVPV